MSPCGKTACERVCVLRPKVYNVHGEVAAGAAGGGASGVSHTASPGDGGASGVSHTASPAEEVTAEEEVHGERRTVRMTDPKKPRPEEILEHEKTHLPFRNWCRHCVRGRGKEAPHVKQTTDPVVPEVHMDFCFLGEEGEPGKTLTVIVVKERQTKMTTRNAEQVDGKVLVDSGVGLPQRNWV